MPLQKVFIITYCVFGMTKLWHIIRAGGARRAMVERVPPNFTNIEGEQIYSRVQKKYRKFRF